MNMNQLPRKGFIYSFDSVNIGDEVNIEPGYMNNDPAVMELQRQEIMRRVREIDAELVWYRYPAMRKLHDPDIVTLKFLKPKISEKHES